MSVGERDGATPDVRRQVLAFDQFHHQRVRRTRILEAVDRRDVWMIERGEYLRFSAEARKPIRIARERLRQDLQRHIAVELRVFGAIHLAHAAGTDGRGDFVNAEAAVSCEGQVVGL